MKPEGARARSERTTTGIATFFRLVQLVGGCFSAFRPVPPLLHMRRGTRQSLDREASSACARLRPVPLRPITDLGFCPSACLPEALNPPSSTEPRPRLWPSARARYSTERGSGKAETALSWPLETR